MNYKLQSLTILVLLINAVYSIKMTKNEVMSLNLNLDQYTSTELCPEYGYPTYMLNTTSFIGHCSFTFYCIDDDNCQSDNDPNSTFFEFIDNYGITHKYIKNNRNYNCTRDSDCLSNNCYQHTCTNGDYSNFTECSDNFILTSEYEGRQNIKCGKIDGTPCNSVYKYNDDCSGRCNRTHCISHYIQDYKDGYDNSYLNNSSLLEPMKYIIVVFLVFILLPLVTCFCCRYRFKEKYPDIDNNPNNYSYNNNNNNNSSGNNNNNNNSNRNLNDANDKGKDKVKIRAIPEVNININDNEKDINHKYQVTQGYKYVFEKKVKRLRALKEMQLPIAITKVSIRRDKLFNDAFDNIMNLPLCDLKRKLKIVYIGERGIDSGGLLKDFFYQLSKEIGNPNYLLLKYSSNNSYELEINSKSSMAGPQHLRYFKFIGRIMGLAIFNMKYFPLPFTILFYKRLIGKKPRFSDLQLIDYELYKNLNWLKENDNVEDLGLYFSIEEEDCFNNRNIIELKPNGANIEVTDENKFEYISLVAKHKLCNTNDEKQFNAIKEGFYEIIPYKITEFLNELDLKYLISGVNEINVEDWKKNTRYEGYTIHDPTIINFWKCVNEFCNEERILLLLFATGSSQIPVTGFKDLQGNGKIELFKIKKIENVNGLPISHTCFNRIDLPPYSTYSQLKQKLLLAITEGITDFQRE